MNEIEKFMPLGGLAERHFEDRNKSAEARPSGSFLRGIDLLPAEGWTPSMCSIGCSIQYIVRTIVLHDARCTFAGTNEKLSSDPSVVEEDDSAFSKAQVVPMPS